MQPHHNLQIGSLFKMAVAFAYLCLPLLTFVYLIKLLIPTAEQYHTTTDAYSLTTATNMTAILLRDSTDSEKHSWGSCILYHTIRCHTIPYHYYTIDMKEIRIAVIIIAWLRNTRWKVDAIIRECRANCLTLESRNKGTTTQRSSNPCSFVLLIRQSSA